MKISKLACSVVVVSSLACLAGCKDDAKPAPAAATSAAATPATSAALAAKPAAAKPDKAHKKSIPVALQPHPVPTDWTELTDEGRGFSFSVPAGSTGKGENKGGVGVFIGLLPKPSDKVLTMVIAYKDAKKTMDDLEKQSAELIDKVFEEVNATKVSSKNLSDDYRLVEMTSEDAKDKTKSHWKALLATDVTDNYIMIVGTPETAFKANEATIDELWGSFDMFSGGASGGAE